MNRGVPLVEVVRSGVVESVHCGHLLLLGESGDVVAALGDVTQPIYPRSSNKPLQAVGMRRLEAQLSAPALALATASHSGEPAHVQLARSVLADTGLTEDDLQCPPDWPLGEAAREAWIRRGLPKQRIAMNCSGKHAAMLRTCVDNGWSRSDYLAVDHPLQAALRDAVADLAGEPVAATGVDGCGAPVFAIGLGGLARAFRRIAAAAEGTRESDVRDAMRAHPELVGGTGRSATALMAGVSGLVAKEGAEGVYAAALPGVGAVTVKIDDGAQRAAEVAVVAGLRGLGITGAALDDWSDAPVFGGASRVGAVRFRAWEQLPTHG
jgi:L-asparaginase II